VERQLTELDEHPELVGPWGDNPDTTGTGSRAMSAERAGRARFRISLTTIRRWAGPTGPSVCMRASCRTHATWAPSAG
jgi:hypothetical protein